MSSETKTANQTQNQTMSSQSVNTGRASAKQEVEKMRANQQSKEGNTGEVYDNSICWGKATKVGTILHSNKTVHVDNGNFENRDKFNKVWTMNNDNQNPVQNENQIGKWKEGATASAICMGDKGTMFTNINGKIYKNSFDVTRYARDGVIIPSSSEADQSETLDFLTYQRMLDPSYEITSGKGSIVIWENLLIPNTSRDARCLKKFLTGLYTPEKFNGSIKIWDWTKDEPVDWISSECWHEISPVELNYGETPVEQLNVWVYEKDGEELHELVPKAEEEYEFKFRYKIVIYILSEENVLTDLEIYGATRDEDRVGFEVFRALRKITHNPQKWGLGTGMDRARGLRIQIFLPACDGTDKTFKSGTKKNLRPDAWEWFPESLKKLLALKFKDAAKLVTKQKKDRAKAFLQDIESRMAEIENLGETGVDDCLATIQDLHDSNYGKGKAIAKKGTKTYKAWLDYKTALEAKKKELQESEPEEPESKSDSDSDSNSEESQVTDPEVPVSGESKVTEPENMSQEQLLAKLIQKKSPESNVIIEAKEADPQDVSLENVVAQEVTAEIVQKVVDTNNEEAKELAQEMKSLDIQEKIIKMVEETLKKAKELYPSESAWCDSWSEGGCLMSMREYIQEQRQENEEEE